jgi:hypothetical protein
LTLERTTANSVNATELLSVVLTRSSAQRMVPLLGGCVSFPKIDLELPLGDPDHDGQDDDRQGNDFE